ncbi:MULTISPECIES: hypothetical protein [Mesorhizobium]|uniref:hypothetical protein n=1 Tax=Mesorhizobium TaxID=68287 RepID=UPI0010109CC0|nr:MULTISPECIES: hypothetical protein [Mesorhizobium]
MKHDHTFDERSKALAQPRRVWRAVVTAFALDLGAKLATGLGIGIGIAVGRALAGQAKTALDTTRSSCVGTLAQIERAISTKGPTHDR